MDGKYALNSTCKWISSAWQQRPWSIFLSLAVLYCASRVILWSAGLRPDIRVVYSHWQYLDVELLRSNILWSLFLLHAQPPLWNGVVGIFLKFADTAEVLQLSWVFASCTLSVLTGGMIFDLVLRSSPSLLLATCATSSWFFLGGAYYYENYIFYPLFTAFLATCAVWCMYKAVATDVASSRCLYLLGVGLGLLALSLTWALFHPLFVVLTMLIATFLAGQINRRKGLQLFTLITLLALAVPIKNLALFGFFSTGSWGGLNLAQVAPIREGADQLADCDWREPEESQCGAGGLVALGEIPQAHPSLIACRKTGAGINFNHVSFISRSAECSRRAIAAIRRNSMAYVTDRILALGSSYQLLPEQYYFHPKGIERIQPYVNIRNLIYFPLNKEHTRYLGAPLGGIWLLFSWIVLFLAEGRRAKGEKEACLLAGLLITWVLFAGHAFNGMEQQRMRFTVEPIGIFVCYAGSPALLQIFRRWRKFIK